MKKTFHFQMAILPIDVKWKNIRKAIILETEHYLKNYCHLLDATKPEDKLRLEIRLNITKWYFDNWYKTKVEIKEDERKEQKRGFIAYMMVDPDGPQEKRKAMQKMGQREFEFE